MKKPSGDAHSDLAALVLLAMGAVLLLLFLAGCSTMTTVRLNQGECLVMVESKQIVTAGQDCRVTRFNR